jgi:GH24 family phage-related lysozyme (muramidase)
MKTSEKGIELIKSFEGCRLVGYNCPAGVPTIGYGHTGKVNGRPVKAGMKITQKTADKLLKTDLKKFEKEVSKFPNYMWSQNEFDALVSFAYNIGSINQLTELGLRSKKVIAQKIPLYNKGGGQVLSGLTKRRLAEQKLFLTKE